MVAFRFRACVVHNDPVVEFSLPDGGTVQFPPACADHVEVPFDLVKDLVDPVIVEPYGLRQLVLDSVDEEVGPRDGGGTVDRTRKLLSKVFLDGQIDLSVFADDVKDARERLSQIGPGNLHPDGVDVRPHEVAVPEIDPGRRHRASHHLCRLPEVVLVVRAPARAIGVYQRRLTATAGPAAPLRVIGRCRRDIAQVHHIELGYVDTKFHGGRAKEQGKAGTAETVLSLLPLF